MDSRCRAAGQLMLPLGPANFYKSMMTHADHKI